MKTKIAVLHSLLVLLQIVQNSGDSMFPTSAIRRGMKSLKKGVKSLASNSTTMNCLGIPETALSLAVMNAFEGLLTQDTKAKDVQFYFHSVNKINGTTVQLEKDFSLDKIDYDIGRDTVFITHGFWSSGREDWVKNMKDAFLKLKDMNVIIVDWEKGSHTWNYLSASISTRIVGSQIAKLVHLIDTKASSESNRIVIERGSLHLIGHSLGSHISAHAAFLVNEMKGNGTLDWEVHRVTGLDPAQPCFTSVEESLKLDRSDAHFVDVIHTNANRALLIGLGLWDQLGHIDFYPNGGKVQLGCSKENPSFLSSINIPGKLVGDIKQAVCSHGRSYELFTDSINVKRQRELLGEGGQCRYFGHKWDPQDRVNVTKLIAEDCEQHIDCPELGIDAANSERSLSGRFYVPTGDKAPYCHFTKENIRSMEGQLAQDEENDKSAIARTVDKFTG